jgi:hypothetical protein
MGDGCTLTVAANALDGAAVLTPDGNLDSSTYRPLRDAVIQAALDEPRAVIIDVGQLEVRAESAWSVFSSARAHVVTWPNTPILIVCEQADRRAAIRRVGVSRWVPVFQTIAAALATLRPLATDRHTARAALPAGLSSLGWSRELVEQWLRTWGLAELTCVTQVIITALIENVLTHTDSRPDVRLETDGVAVTVAVEDSSHAQACLPETASSSNRPSGLRIVNALCRQWGNAPMLSGKTVWAVIGPENRL